MRVIVLGSAAGGGFPQWNCGCANCRRARAGDPAAKPRTQSSLAVSADGENWLVLNAAPEILKQIAATPALHPRRGLRDTPIAEVVVTNADVDHVAGLLSLRERQPFTLYATERVLSVLRANSIFNVLAPEIVTRTRIAHGEMVELEAGLRLEAFAVPGKVALYLENAESARLDGEGEDAIGLRISEPDTGAAFFFVPAAAAVDDELAGRLRGAKLLFFDGTLWRDDEMIAAGLSRKTGARMGHISVSGNAGSLAAFAAAAVERKIYLHINNSNPMLLDDSPERSEVEAAGWEIAYDGMEIRL